MSLRGGRDRQRRDLPLRSEEKSHHGRSTAPPSRHLWVGNLSHTLTERALSNHFRQFGELESVAFQPGRSYAFINFIDDRAAFAALGALQGFILAGNALRIEFTKAEKSSTSSHDEDYLQRRDETRSTVRGSPFPQRDSRSRHISSDPIYRNESPKENSKNAEPSEVLWVGFPQSLKVNEDSFWNAFSPFGEIEKISAFSGRTYAFVRYKHLSSACRAKEALQGKLFGDPRVHICFARSESGTSNSGRNLMNDPPSPRNRLYGRQGSSENFRHDRYHETSSMERSRRSPRFGSNLESEGFNDASMGFDRKGNRLTNRNDPFEHQTADIGLPGNMYGRRSPSRDRGGNFHDFPSKNFSHQGPLYDDEWDLPEDALVYHGAKKLKSSIPPEPELPEYPFSDSEQVKHVHPRLPEFSQRDMLDNNVGHFGYHKQIPDPPVNIPQHYGERVNSHNPSYDTFQTGSVSLPQKPVEWKRSTPEPQHPPASAEWKWEGIIAKGGTSICRARCFPVGKVLDMILPEFLDCTARTSLDMLAKHYYQAASSWVVFFVPESDADMGFYNEFMNYLGEKQRAAVAKLDDKTTLFLVPPSDFSEKILKVPGKLSISGVILRLEQPSSTVEALPPPPQSERPDPYLMTSHAEASRTSFSSPSGPYPPAQPFQHLGKPRANTSLPGLPPGPIPFHVNRNMADPIIENPQEHMLHQQGTHPQNLQNLISGGRNLAAPPRAGGDYMIPANDSVMPRTTQETSSSAIQHDQLAQLASFLGNSRQSGSGISTADDFRQSSNTMIPDNASYRMPRTLPSPSTQIASEHSSSQYRQVQQFQQQQMSNMPQMPQGDFSTSSQGNAQVEADADPQKRLQATLELAATLLKQIQQGKT
ncbi:flowering time control protein FPA isoform X2 [Cynara cardunculus var. scolymus]|uniref:flowering time control protein FPA isoform X2 n=1 Tax=Cynara cardunculus var. scolymus TaxID=59895 RepID=UPI000D629C2B|nr:flowering time control protein FPA isoform X2 [Cynara cardunculus var. scolymus]